MRSNLGSVSMKETKMSQRHVLRRIVLGVVAPDVHHGGGTGRSGHGDPQTVTVSDRVVSATEFQRAQQTAAEFLSSRSVGGLAVVWLRKSPAPSP
jgi:hypothetical protein